MNQNTKHLKWASTLFIVGYLIYLARKNGGTLEGNPHGYRVGFNSDLAIDMLSTPITLANPLVGTALKYGAKRVAENLKNAYGIR